MIKNSTFTQWSRGSPVSSHNANIIGPNHWYIKTMNGGLHAICHNTPNGMRVDAHYPTLGYLYIRQLIPNVMQFSGKSGVLSIDITRNSWQPIDWDVYIRARLTSDNSVDRPLVIDSSSSPLEMGRQTINVAFTVPDLLPHQHKISGGNALTTAFRLIGRNQNTQCTVHSIKMVLDNNQPPAEECPISDVCIERIAERVAERLRG